MKSRSHNRIPTWDPTPDDWVDGSWTVDCVCGVNFDDGEEMVNCDDCGVWVHTRCSRYVKSEKLFACDKCKMSKNDTRSNDSNETEVAQMLIDLPATTLMMDNPHPPPTTDLPHHRRRLWTDIPIQERVHVQGIPGGEPTLFGAAGAGSSSSVFTPQLWKSTGYVPKKFNFQYREFPCWDEGEVIAKNEEENENSVDKGAGVLFSLSKKNVVEIPMETSVGMRIQVDNGGFHRLSSPSEEMKKPEGDSVDGRCVQSGVKKDGTLVPPFMVDLGKCKKEISGTSKARSRKKKIRVVHGGGDCKKSAPQVSKTVSMLSSDARHLEFCEDQGPNIVKTHSQTIKNADSRTIVVKDPLPGDHVVENNVAKPIENLSSTEKPSEDLVFDVSGYKFPLGAKSVERKTGHQLLVRSDSSYRTDVDRTSLLEKNDAGHVPVKEKADLCLDNEIENGGGSPVSSGYDRNKSNPIVQDAPTAVAEGEYGHNPQRPGSLAPGTEVKTEAELDNLGGTFNIDSFTVSDVKKPDDTKYSTQQFGISANLKTNDTAVTSSQFTDHKMQNGNSMTKTTINYEPDTADKFASNPCQPDQPVEEVKASIATGKGSSELEHDSRSAEEPSKVSSTVAISQAPYSQCKLVAPSSVSSTIMISKHAVLDKSTTSNAQNHNPIIKKRISHGMKKDNESHGMKKDNVSVDMSRGEERHKMLRKWKDGSKTSVSSVLKASHSNRILHASDSKKTLSNSKDPLHYACSKASSTNDIGITSGSGEPSSSLQSQSGSHLQNKVLVLGLPQRGEKVNQSNNQPSTKVPVHLPGPSSSTTLLSDEKLALLLHQQLNSSPRVPRAPRMRHTGSLPQLGSPTGASMLIKRASSSGGRDHNVFSRRKAKDLRKHESCSGEIDDETKIDRFPPSRYPRRHDSACAVDAVAKRETDSGYGKVRTVKEIAPSVSTAAVSSGPSSSNEAKDQKLSSTCNSLRNISDDDTGTITSPNHRTLPGLIAEILSKGKRMMYEELCSAVLPHWPNLRKPNGEHYAYSSHSHAVLDCLRSRQEWVQLVDRGPKTNVGRKRRKLDAEAPSFEPEYGKNTAGKDIETCKNFESRLEEFPKGKRKVRRRSRLSLRGRSVKDVRKQRKGDDADSFSSCSDDEIQVVVSSPTSSDERETGS